MYIILNKQKTKKNMKTILFITSDSTYKAFDYVIEELGEEYKCFVVDSLAKALKVLEAGIDQVVMYPFYIKYYGYNLNLGTTQDTRVFAGYCFWKQELAEKAIRTIVINSQKLQVSSLMSEIEKTGWDKEANVIFFDYNKGYQSSLELANLIKT